MDDEKGAAPVSGAARALGFAAQNLGIFFDVIIFFVNLFLMRLLTGNFIKLFARSDHDDIAAQTAMFLFCVALFALLPCAAILKRYGYHRRRKLRLGVDENSPDLMSGCLFNPIFFFCLSLVIMSAINAFVMQIATGGHREPGEALFVTMTFLGLGFTIVQTYLVYRFFIPPKHEPKWNFLKDQRAEALGNLLAFLNILLYQVAWNALLGSFGFGPVTDLNDFGARLFLLSFLALLLYFPPRILFLAEDIKKPAAWFTILLANSPIIIRVLFGVSLF